MYKDMGILSENDECLRIYVWVLSVVFSVSPKPQCSANAEHLQKGGRIRKTNM